MCVEMEDEERSVKSRMAGRTDTGVVGVFSTLYSVRPVTKPARCPVPRELILQSSQSGGRWQKNMLWNLASVFGSVPWKELITLKTMTQYRSLTTSSAHSFSSLVCSHLVVPETLLFNFQFHLKMKEMLAFWAGEDNSLAFSNNIPQEPKRPGNVKTCFVGLVKEVGSFKVGTMTADAAASFCTCIQ